MAKKISEKTPKATPDKKVRTSHLEEAQTKIQEQIDELQEQVNELKAGQLAIDQKLKGTTATTPVQDAAKKAFDGAMASGTEVIKES